MGNSRVAQQNNTALPVLGLHSLQTCARRHANHKLCHVLAKCLYLVGCVPHLVRGKVFKLGGSGRGESLPTPRPQGQSNTYPEFISTCTKWGTNVTHFSLGT